MKNKTKTVFIKASSIRKDDVLTNGFIASEDARYVDDGKVLLTGTSDNIRGIQHRRVEATKVVEKVVF
jgi:hypothetical protein